jgi:hypothetical protein
MGKKLKYLVGFLIVAVLAAGAFYFGYWVKTPQYTLNLIANSVVNHDTAAFEKHVDLDNLFSQLFDDAIAAEFHLQTAPANPFLQNQIIGIKSTIVPVFTGMAKNFVQSGTIGSALDAAGTNAGRGGQLAEGMAVKLGVPYMVYKNITGVTKNGDNEAIVSLSIEDKQTGKALPVRFRMVRLEDGTWQIKQVANVKEYLEARQAAIAAKLAELNKPIQDQINAAVKIVDSGAKAPRFTFLSLVEGLPVAGIGADFSLTNLGTKDILSVSGSVTIKDAEGTPRFTDGFEVGGIQAGKTISAHNSWALNPFVDDQQKLAANTKQQISGSFAITSVIFKDNTSLTLMDKLPTPQDPNQNAPKGAPVK